MNKQYTNKGARHAILFFTRQIKNYEATIKANHKSQVIKDHFQKIIDKYYANIRALNLMLKVRKNRDITVLREVKYYEVKGYK